LNRERIPRELFSAWGGQIVYGSLVHEFGVMSLLVLAIVVLLVLHVTFRATLEHEPRSDSSAESRSRPRSDGRPKHLLLRVYERAYFPLTAVCFFTLLATYFW